MVPPVINRQSGGKLNLEVVSQEKIVYKGLVDKLAAPGVNGELGILPDHCALISLLKAGELKIWKGCQDIRVDLSGGFIIVKSNRVTVLADLPPGSADQRLRVKGL